MCGIAGLYAYSLEAPPPAPQALARMSGQMLARGPDGAGEWYSPDQRVALAHRRLSIIDLSERGAQPMSINDGSLTISFNGEIYNYRELRAQLEARGRIFRSDSDTEVLLHLYAEKGQDMLQELRGMFAFRGGGQPQTIGAARICPSLSRGLAGAPRPLHAMGTAPADGGGTGPRGAPKFGPAATDQRGDEPGP